MAERHAPRLTPEAQAYTRAVADVRHRLVEFSAAAYSAVGVDDPGMAALVERVVPAVEAAQVRVANLTAVHLARQAGVTPLDVDEDLVTRGRGVDPALVYQRPIIVARSALAEHKPFVDAKAAGAQRLEQLVTTDVQMAKVRQADRSLRAAGQDRYRRVPKGESTCALCRIAATQPYSVGDLLPIHPGCDCGVDEIPAGLNLDDLLDVEALLESTHAKVEAFTDIADRGGRAVDYRKLLITEEHGEIGPLLAWDGQKFTGESQIHDGRPAAKESKADIASRQLPSLEESLANLRDQGLAEDSPQVEWHKKQIARMQADLAADHEPGTTREPDIADTEPTNLDDGAVPPPPDDPTDAGAAVGDDDFEHNSDLSAEQQAEAMDASVRMLADIEPFEPDITAAARTAIETNGGDVQRIDSRWKSLKSLYRKIQGIMVEDETSAAEASLNVNDVLRYTAVLDGSDYWTRGDEIAEALVQAGYERTNQSLGWKRAGYRGRNESFMSPEGVEFEVQLHTAESLHAAEITHEIYEEQRLTTTPPERKAELRAMQKAIFDAVPVPADIRWVPQINSPE